MHELSAAGAATVPEPRPPCTGCPTVNLAVGMAAVLGLRVGLMDADIHGPSVPTMMNLRGEPRVAEGVARGAGREGLCVVEGGGPAHLRLYQRGRGLLCIR